MMTDHNERMKAVCEKALKQVALGEPCGLAVGHGFVPQLNQMGQVTGVVPGWTITVTLRGTGIGEQIANPLPIPQVLVDDDTIKQAVQAAYRGAVQARDQQDAQAVQAADQQARLQVAAERRTR